MELNDVEIEHEVRDCWLASGRRVVLLTVFYKTKEREIAEVERAKRARKTCESEHGHAQGQYTREV